MIFEPRDCSKIRPMSVAFPQFSIDVNLSDYVQAFKYLGHTLSENDDIMRDTKRLNEPTGLPHTCS